MRMLFHLVAAAFVVGLGAAQAPAEDTDLSSSSGSSPYVATPPPLKLVEMAAEPAEPMKLSEPWIFSITPFLWLPSVNGTLEANGVTFDANGNTSDTIDRLDEQFDFGICLHVEASRGRFGILSEVMYIDVSAQRTSAIGTILDGDMKGFIGELGVFYTFAQPSEPRETGALRVDLLGGVRATGMELGVESQLFGSASQEEWWFDPYVGIRGELGIVRWLSLRGRFDVGGFDLGASELVWNALAAASFHFGKAIDLDFGWRWLHYDFETGSGSNEYALDALLSGPYVALTFRF